MKAQRLHLAAPPRRPVVGRGILWLLLALTLPACDFFSGGVDERAPEVTIVRPGNEARISGEVSVLITAEPRGGADNYISFINVIVDGKSSGSATLVEGTDPAVYIYRWNTSTLADGSYRIEAIAFDRQQARGLSNPVQVTVENVSSGPGPTVAVVSPRDGEEVSGVVRVIAQAQPGEPAISRADVIIDGVSIATLDEAPFTYDWNVAAEPPGVRVIQVKAYGTDGAFSLSTPVAVTVVAEDEGGGGGGTPGTGSSAKYRAAGLTGEVKGSVAVGFNNDLYVGTLDDTLYAFSPTGRVRWKAATQGAIRSSPVVGNNEDIFVTSEDGRLYGFTSTGQPLWTPYNTGTILRATPALGVEGNLYFGDGSGRLHAVNSFSGLSASGWPIQVTDAPIIVPPVIARDRAIIVAATDGYVYAYGPDGKRKWKSAQNIGSVSVGMALVEQEFEVPLPNGNTTTSKATVIYLVSNDGHLYALAGTDGSVLWSHELTGPLRSGPVVGPDGVIYVGTSTGLVALNEEANAFTPRLRFIFPASDVGTPAVDANENIYFVSGRKLVAINPNNTPLWEFNLDTQADGPLTIGRDGLIYVAGNNGLLYGIDTGSQGLAPEHWPMFQRNARHTGRIGIDATDG